MGISRVTDGSRVRRVRELRSVAEVGSVSPRALERLGKFSFFCNKGCRFSTSGTFFRSSENTYLGSPGDDGKHIRFQSVIVGSCLCCCSDRALLLVRLLCPLSPPHALDYVTLSLQMMSASLTSRPSWSPSSLRSAVIESLIKCYLRGDAGVFASARRNCC